MAESFLQWLGKRYALSRQGAKDLVKGCLSCFLQNLALMAPVAVLYRLVTAMMQGEHWMAESPLYALMCFGCVAALAAATWVQYHATYFATYQESGVRRITLAEKLRKLPLSYFGQRDLADLTSVLMADSAFLETAFSHFIPELAGSIASTTLVALCLIGVQWKMALAALWVLPVSFLIVGCSARVQEALNQRQMDAKMACAGGIQECIETIQDLRANGAENSYLAGLKEKIHAVERRAIASELGTAVFVVSASLVLKLGIVTVAITGASLLVAGEIGLVEFFLFLLVVSRLYDPLQGALQNLAAVISARVNIGRLREILERVSEEYDYILIDTPPLNIVTDALVIPTDLADMILVCRVGKTTYDQYEKALSSIRLSGMGLLGTVMNQVETGTGSYGRYYKKYEYR